jgi:hypothetical protein
VLPIADQVLEKIKNLRPDGDGIGTSTQLALVDAEDAILE